MACTSAHAREIMQKQEETGLVVLIGYQRHYDQRFRWVRQKIAAGLIGRVTLTHVFQGQNWLRSQQGAWRLVPELSGEGRAGLAVGGPFGDAAGVVRSGNVKLFRFIADPQSTHHGLDPEPLAIIGGETDRPGSQFGLTLHAGTTDGHAFLIIGAHESSALGLDQGAAYLVNLSGLGF